MPAIFEEIRRDVWTSSKFAGTLTLRKSLKEIVDTLNAHYEPKTFVIEECFQFHRRNQGTNELITDCVSELHRLASCCQFEAYLDDALRDQFVCSILSNAKETAISREAHICHGHTGNTEQGKGREEC